MTEIRYSHDIDQVTGIQDDLGRGPMVEAISNEIIAHIEKAHDEPRIIGIYGGWGSGKSFLLSQVIARLQQYNQNSDHSRLILGTYKAWQYEAVGDLAPGLIRVLETINNQYNQGVFGDLEQLKDTAQKLLRLISVTGPLLGPIGIAVGEAANKALDLVTERSQIEDVRLTMNRLVEAVLTSAREINPSYRYRLVIFIDDLDRCSPENMVRMFEWLKVHLSAPNCTYVLALDHRAAAQAIIGRYKEYISQRSDNIGLGYGLRYLEKLVDQEYELGPATRVEQMAIHQVFGYQTGQKRLSAVMGEQVGHFPGRVHMNNLLEMRTLQLPRTMLKILAKYKNVMEILSDPAMLPLRQRLRNAYPLWTLLLTAMYYRLDPSHLDDFIRGRGNIYSLLKDYQSVPEDEWAEDPTSPLYEFCHFAYNLNKQAGSTIPFPAPKELRELAEIVRQNAPLVSG